MGDARRVDARALRRSQHHPLTVSDRVAIVTGGNSRLGGAIARAFVDASASVVIAARDRARGEAAAGELGALFVETDIGTDDSIERCIRETLDRYGRIDFLVNNAVVYADAGLETTRDEWLQALNVNVVGTAVFVREAARHMEPGSAIVNIGSVGGKFGAAGRAVYPASKAAILQLTKNQAADLAPRGIRVNSVSPGWTWSDPLERMSGGSRERADRGAANTQPLGRAGDADEVAAAVLFLCSPAASFITGADLPADGGFSMLGPDQGRGARYWIDREPG
jgi:NAD(P)-dependent dehydrogenase (short-subunit alcohol dehydrogenase family)